MSTRAIALLVETVRMTVPYACAALGGIWSEKSGIINIGLEGILLGGALAAIVGTLVTGSGALGILSAWAVGALLGLALAALVRRGVDAILAGLALNIVAAGATRFILRALYGSSSNSPVVAGLWVPNVLAKAPAIVRVVLDPLTLATVAATVATAHLLGRTRFGLAVRASGDDEAAARSLGIDLERHRAAALLIGGAICGMGGAALALDLRQFQSQMSGGRGFIALAAVVVARRSPGRALGACALFALLDALGLVLQGVSRVSHDLVSALPFVVTLVALAAVGQRKRHASLD